MSNKPKSPFDNPMVRGGLAAGAAMMLYNALDKQYFLGNDLGLLWKLLKVKRGISTHMGANNTTADIWEQVVDANPNKTFLLFEGKKYSYKEIDRQANRVAAWAQTNHGIKKGDVVALYMENRAEYVPFWMGMAKLGAITALLNHNVKGKPLHHCLTVSGAKLLIAGTEVIEPVLGIKDTLLSEGWALAASGPGVPSGFVDVDPLLTEQTTKRPKRSLRKGIVMDDKALLVYTSGTTGLPKAATITHLRFFSMGKGFQAVFEVGPSDRVYCVLPLYHSAGGLCGVGMTIQAGATLVLKRKFSAREFWPDCRKHNVTVVQYIGELCRYLLGTPVHNEDPVNKVRIAIGNGLRPEIWNEFQTRFGVPQIGEFYGSTEGNVALFNHCTTKDAQGSVGRLGALAVKMLKLKLVKFDVASEEPIRDKNGFCIECGVGEPGELLGLIDNTDPLKKFAGYHGNDKATQKKVARDVFTKGDVYFRTGDLLSYDEKGYWHFVDRIGDTFRWKGENVSTTEVTEVVSMFEGVEEVNIYGVEVPNGDGRACCAAMVCAPSLDFHALAKHCDENLPGYAMPLFIRKLPKIDVTGTFKHQKVALRKEGADPTLVKDDLLVLDKKNLTYVPFGVEGWDALVRGKSKL